MVQAQEYLDLCYPKEKRGKIIDLKINNKSLEGCLDLSDFVNLKTLECLNNKLTSLKLDKCENLQSLKAHNHSEYDNFNELSDISFLDQLPNPKKLKFLYLCGNNILGDLSPFSRFTGLEELDLGLGDGYDKEFIERRGNKLHGSLKPLRGLTKLKKLDISNTDISYGLEYLPENLERIYCDSEGRSKSLCRGVQNQLKPYGERNYNYQVWRKNWNNILERSRDIQKDIGRFFGSWSKEEVRKLKDPDQLGTYKYAIRIPQWGGRVASVVGGSLIFVGAGDANSSYTRTGGVIAIISPFVEAISSYMEKRYYEYNENKWDRFIQDSKKLWGDYQDLVDFVGYSYLDINNLKKGSDGEKEDEEINGNKWHSLKELVDKTKNEIKEAEQNYSCLEFWKKDNKNSNSEEKVIVSKNQFAQYLQKNWEKENFKENWEKIGRILVEMNMLWLEMNNKDNGNKNEKLILDRLDQVLQKQDKIIEINDHQHDSIIEIPPK